METVKSYKKRLGESIEKCMTEWSMSERTAAAIDQMVQCWLHTDDMCKHLSTASFTAADAEAWAAGLVNDDGSAGAHWDMAQTTAAAENIGIKFEHITCEEWYATMNAMYSDYSRVADKYGISTADFYADLAKAFLFDKDAPPPKQKLAAYYHCIVEG